VNESGGLTTSPLDRLIFALSITDCAGRSQGRGKGGSLPKTPAGFDARRWCKRGSKPDTMGARPI
jgi:hypothetical protein